MKKAGTLSLEKGVTLLQNRYAKQGKVANFDTDTVNSFVIFFDQLKKMHMGPTIPEKFVMNEGKSISLSLQTMSNFDLMASRVATLLTES